MRLAQIVPGAYLAVAIHGRHGAELAYAALRAGDTSIGAPRRSPSFPCNAWEVPVRGADANYTYYIPLHPALAGRTLEAVVLVLKGGGTDLGPQAWLTAYPTPLAARELVLT